MPGQGQARHAPQPCSNCQHARGDESEVRVATVRLAGQGWRWQAVAREQCEGSSRHSVAPWAVTVLAGTVFVVCIARPALMCSFAHAASAWARTVQSSLGHAMLGMRTSAHARACTYTRELSTVHKHGCKGDHDVLVSLHPQPVDVSASQHIRPLTTCEEHSDHLSTSTTCYTVSGCTCAYR